MGTRTPRSLFSAVFFMNGKVLCLRGGREHKALKISQFKFGTEDGKEFLEYTENGSKNRSGSYKDKSGNKIVRQLAQILVCLLFGPTIPTCFFNLFNCFLYL